MPNVYFFANGQADGSAQMKDILGGQRASLHVMTRLGIPVPPGFTIAASLCAEYLVDTKLPEDLCNEVKDAMSRLESATGRRFGVRRETNPDDFHGMVIAPLVSRSLPHNQAGCRSECIID